MILSRLSFIEYISIFAGIITIIGAVISAVQNIRKKRPYSYIKPFLHRLKIGYVLLPIFILLSGLLIYQSFQDNDVIFLKIAWGMSSLSMIYLSIIANKSFSETKIVEPEWFWRLFFNQVPTRFEKAFDSKIKILILYANDCEKYANEILWEQNSEDTPLNICLFKCTNENQQELLNIVSDNNIFGIYILYSDELGKLDWALDFCEEWAVQHKGKPVVYTNLSDSDVRLHFGRVSNKQYKYGLLRLFERSHQRAELWEKQSVNYRRACIAIILFLLFGYCISYNIVHNSYKQIQENQLVVDEMESYNKDFSMKNAGFKYVKDLKCVFEEHMPKGIFSKEPYFKYHAEATLKKICNVNGLSYEELKHHARLTYWKKGYDEKIHKIISNRDEKESTSFSVNGESIIGGAFLHPDNFILFLKNKEVIKVTKISVTEDSESLNEILARSVGFSLIPPDSKDVTALIAYCLKDETERDSKNNEELTGVCLEIQKYENVSFMDERKTRAILRTSLREIHLFPRSLFFEK